MRDSITDVPGLRVGHWTDREAATGCTVVLCPPEGAAAACAVLGGAPGTRETDALDPGNQVERAHAVLLTGGSAYGLDAAGGVMRWLEQHGIGYEMRSARVPIVPAAVIYDLGIGRADVRPDAAAGYAACRVAATSFATGSVGAGTGATVAKVGGPGSAVKGGLGTAGDRMLDGVTIGAIVAVNALGEIVDPDNGRLVAAARTADGRPLDTFDHMRRRTSPPPAPIGNTTIGIIATDLALNRLQLMRLAIMAHAGFARAIRPSHTPADGDTIFALSTGAITVEPVDLVALGTLAARTMERAIVRGVRDAAPLAGVPSCRSAIVVRAATGADRPWIESLVEREWGAAVVVTRGQQVRPCGLDALIAERDGAPAGLATLAVRGGACEIVTLNALRPGNGAGRALMDAAAAYAKGHGCVRLEVVTTNDNLHALGFFQRRGMRIAEYRPDAVVAARAIKPEIPEIGAGGIPIRDEIVLVIDL